jgi:hypothetical protein
MKKCSLLRPAGILALAFYSFFDAPPCSADPASSTRWLMDQPASLFDLGILRLRQRNKEEWTPELDMKSKDKGILLDNLGINNVVYNSDNNTIAIMAAFIVPYVEKVNEKLCASILGEYKNIISRSRNNLPTGFDHIGYSDRARPKDLNDNINKILVFTIRISEPRVLGGKTISCSIGMDEESPHFQKNF